MKAPEKKVCEHHQNKKMACYECSDSIAHNDCNDLWHKWIEKAPIEDTLSKVKFEYYDEEGAVLEEVSTLGFVYGESRYEIKELAKAIRKMLKGQSND